MRELIYQGKALPLHFGMKAINNYTKLQGATFESSATTTAPVSNIESIVSLTRSGLNEGARKSGSDKRYTEDDVWDIFDEEPTLILTVSELFIEAIAPLTDKLGSIAPKNESPTASLSQ